jgi:hypothetical protein
MYMYVSTRYVQTAHEQMTDPSQAPRAHSCSATPHGSFLNVKLHRSSLLQNQNRPEHHYSTYKFYLLQQISTTGISSVGAVYVGQQGAPGPGR